MANPRYWSELEQWESIPRQGPQGAVIDPRTLPLEAQEAAKEPWRAFLAKHVQRLSGGLVDGIRQWAFGPPIPLECKPDMRAAKTNPEEFGDDDLPPF